VTFNCGVNTTGKPKLKAVFFPHNQDMMLPIYFLQRNKILILISILHWHSSEEKMLPWENWRS